MNEVQAQLAHEEWDAWQNVCKQWPKDMDINDPVSAPLVAAIILWGEKLSYLRQTQTADQRGAAHGKAFAQCLKLGVIR